MLAVNIKSDQIKLDHKHKMNKWIIIRFQKFIADWLYSSE